MDLTDLMRLVNFRADVPASQRISFRRRHLPSGLQPAAGSMCFVCKSCGSCGRDLSPVTDRSISSSHLLVWRLQSNQMRPNVSINGRRRRKSPLARPLFALAINRRAPMCRRKRRYTRPLLCLFAHICLFDFRRWRHSRLNLTQPSGCSAIPSKTRLMNRPGPCFGNNPSGISHSHEPEISV
jgi:hypothetical protein